MEAEILREFKEQTCYRLDESTRMIYKALEEINEEEIWKRFNESSNSIGNLILHLCGNIRQYAIASLGNQKDIRIRNEEFSSTGGHDKQSLLTKLSNTVEESKEVLKNCSHSEMMRKREVQGFHFTGIGIAIHVTEHYSYHTGQIAFWVKQLKNKKDLGFYKGFDLNLKNKN
ncbi:DUF1572 domain-containing protein [Aquimarina sp. ERC-38]|uniref:DinB family protein n=1 Tax=Aquimarina sp. ERC-38 TaxID=2949996 RepID=UPI002247739A|nr:DinB family protein [Aquimarina sp. ERC-38]UZO80278.1 DUF1572 domain-containing protein [Aquimarina sp. ERC-38]